MIEEKIVKKDDTSFQSTFDHMVDFAARHPESEVAKEYVRKHMHDISFTNLVYKKIDGCDVEAVFCEILNLINDNQLYRIQITKLDDEGLPDLWE